MNKRKEQNILFSESEILKNYGNTNDIQNTFEEQSVLTLNDALPKTIKGNQFERFDDANRIGETMRELRKLKGWKQIEVARALGIPLTTYNAYELGYNRQHGGLIIALAKLYNVTTDRILGFKDKENSPCTIICIDSKCERQIYTLEPQQFDFVQMMICAVEKI